MRVKRHSKEPIIAILKQAGGGMTAEVCRQHGISEQTAAALKKYAGWNSLTRRGLGSSTMRTGG
jgi:hypothetical protein